MSRRHAIDRTRIGLEQLEDRAVPAAVGALDPSFGVGGQIVHNVFAGNRVEASRTDPSGRIVIAVTAFGGSADFGVVRLNPDGSLDTTFGVGGKSVIDFGGTDVPKSIALDPGGNIVVGGSTKPAAKEMVAVTRLLPNGAIDTGFGLSGKVILPVPGSDLVADTVLSDVDGGVVVAGTLTTAGVSSFSIGKLTSAGAIDTSFGTSGNITFNFAAGTSDTLQNATWDASGHIAVVGDSTNGGAHRVAVARLTAAGALDNTFGTNGKTAFNMAPTSDDNPRAIRSDENSRLVIAGGTEAGFNYCAVARLNQNGDLDPSFATGGKFLTLSSPLPSRAFDLLIRPNGRIVVGGVAGSPTGTYFVLARLTPNGSLDTTFNANGSLAGDPGAAAFQFNAGGFDTCLSVVPGVDERIVAVGTDPLVAPYGIKVARLIGSVEKGSLLVVGGPATGVATAFDAAPATGQYSNTPAATVSPFGAVAVRTATGDVNGDGAADAVLVTGPGAPIRFTVLDGRSGATLIPATAPFLGSEDFAGGGFVAAADLDGDGRAEIIVTPDQGGGPRVTIFSLVNGTPTVRANFFGIDDANFRGGCRAATGDVNGDGSIDLAVAAGFLGGPRVALFNGKTLYTLPTRLVGDFFAFPGADAVTLRNGVFVAAGDVDGDGFADLIFGGGPGGAPRVFILGGNLVSAGNVEGAQASPVANFFVAGNASDRGGVRLTAKDADGDQRADVVVGGGEGSPAIVRIYLGKNFTTTGEPSTFQDLTVFGGTALAGGVFVG
ncbi:MAG: FG-GAP-like repeat-containing protein [Gemmataceae bacterium]